MLIIDGNNLLLADGKPDAMAGLDEASLIGWLERSRFAQQTGGVLVVFDGPAAPGRKAPGNAGPGESGAGGRGVCVVFSGADPADGVIAEAVAACSYPKRTLVVSGDRQVQKQARARRCRVLSGPAFLHELVRAVGAAGGEPPPTTDTAQWLRDFGFDQDAEAVERQPRPRPRSLEEEVDALMDGVQLPPELDERQR